MPLIPLIFLGLLGVFVYRQVTGYRNPDHADPYEGISDHPSNGTRPKPQPVVPDGWTVETYSRDGLQQFQILLTQEARRRRPTQTDTAD